MTRRALLLGAAYGTLYHVPQSLDRLEAALKKYDFRHVELFIDLHSERLLAVLARFISLVEPGDPVAIAYVGHADRRAGIGYLRPSPDRSVVVGLELGAQLAALLRTTANVTFILDCCCAAGVLEDASHLDEANLQRIIAGQLAQTRGLEALHQVSPLDRVVQLLAAAATQNAVEDLDQGTGLFSGALADVLEHCVGLEVGWHEVLDEVRLRVRRVDREQAPVLGGLHRFRVPFTERDSQLCLHDYACAHSGPNVHLAVGTLVGVAVGDRFSLRRLGSAPAEPAPTSTVTSVGPDHAVMALDDGSRLPDLAAPLRAARVATTSVGRPRTRWQRLSDALACAPRLPSDAFDIRWGSVDPDGHLFSRLPEQGARLGPDDDLWIAFGTLRNEYAFQLFFSAFHLCPDDRLVDLSPAYPQGLPLQAEHHYALTSRFAHGLAHADALEWPKRQPPGGHALVFLVSTRPIPAETLAERVLEVTLGPPTPSGAVVALARFTFTVA